MGFFSGIRRRIKKLIPKEIRPAIPFIAAAAPFIPGIPGLGSIANPFTKAALAKMATDDEADVKDVVRTGLIAAAPAAISRGVTSAAGGDNALANFLNKSRAVEGGTSTIARGIESAVNPESFMGQAKLIGSQAATDFGIKQAELNEKAIEEYERDLLQKGIRDKGARRSAIFDIFVNAGYDDDEVNVMLDKYGYKKGGKVDKFDEGFEYAKEGLEMLKEAEEKEPMEIRELRLASGGDVDILETEEEEIITPEYLMKEEGVPIGEQVSNPSKMDSLNQLSLMLFNKPVFELTEEQFEMLKEFASDRAAMQVGYEPGKYSDEEIEMYENYKYNMNEQMPGMPIIDIDEFLRMEYGQGRMGVAKGGPIKTQKPDMEKDTKGKTAGPDYYIKRIEDLMDLGYDYETAGRIAYDYDEYRSAMDKGPIDDDYKEGGSVIKKKKIITIGTGKLKDYPGIKKILEMNKKGKKRFSKADGGEVDKKKKKKYKRDGMEFDEPLGPKGTFDLRNPPKRYEVAEGGLMNLAGNELDLRGGGFVPMGKKEKADDVPARLSKNEFVFTADAVRAAGGGSVQKGADLMYDTMKKLEAQS